MRRPIALDLAYDLPCPRCGYNLRGLKMDGRCPECAQPVADALPRPIDGDDAAALASRIGTAMLLAFASAIGTGVLGPIAILQKDMPTSTILLIGVGLGALLSMSCVMLGVQAQRATVLLREHGQPLREWWIVPVLTLSPLAVVCAMLATATIVVESLSPSTSTIWAVGAAVPIGLVGNLLLSRLAHRLGGVLERATGSVASLRPSRSIWNKWRD